MGRRRSTCWRKWQELPKLGSGASPLDQRGRRPERIGQAPICPARIRMDSNAQRRRCGSDALPRSASSLQGRRTLRASVAALIWPRFARAQPSGHRRSVERFWRSSGPLLRLSPRAPHRSTRRRGQLVMALDPSGRNLLHGSEAPCMVYLTSTTGARMHQSELPRADRFLLVELLADRSCLSAISTAEERHSLRSEPQRTSTPTDPA